MSERISEVPNKLSFMRHVVHKARSLQKCRAADGRRKKLRAAVKRSPCLGEARAVHGLRARLPKTPNKGRLIMRNALINVDSPLERVRSRRIASAAHPSS